MHFCQKNCKIKIHTPSAFGTSPYVGGGRVGVKYMETKTCQNCKNKFVIEPDDFGFYEKIKVPPPTFCPDCRSQRRLAWRNDFVFYNRNCDLCKRKIISIYSPDNPQIIYCNKCWWSDEWDPKSYAQDFDFSKSFFEQFSDFRKKIPAIALMNDNGIGSENCEYTQDFAYGKNCFMTMVAWKVQDCMYLVYAADAKDTLDSMGILSPSEGLYEAMYSEKCFGSRNIYISSALIDCAYCYDCNGCQSCFQCIGLRNKKYCIQNKEYSKEEYEKIINSYKLDTWSGSEKAHVEFENFILTKPRKYASLKNCVNCTGNNLTNSKNVKNVFGVRRAENCRYLETGDTEKDSYDLSTGGELSECYEGLTPDHSNRALFAIYTWHCVDVFYSEFCQSSQNCFGCVGLKHGQYSVLNKQYSKEEYEKLKEKIIEHMKTTGEWGEFFPMKYSPFAYNESVAQIHFSLTKEQVLGLGLRWQDNIQETRGQTTLLEIPDSINDVPDSITNEILECVGCKRNYKIIPNELFFYRKWKIPIPRKCFFCRLARCFELRGPSRLWHRQCMCDKSRASTDSARHDPAGSHFHGETRCEVEFETSYAPDRPEIVYCEKCYQQEVY